MDLGKVFQDFRDQLDDHNDTRERLIKTSRDITIISKKTIFLIHRVLTESHNDHDPAQSQPVAAAAQAKLKLKQVQALFARIKSELAGDCFWRYQKQVSPGLQEYIEALSFAWYLDTGKLISAEEVQRTLCDEDGVPYFQLPLADYVLGLADLTGELMRYAISGIARRGGRSLANDICAFVRQCKADFERLTPYIRELSKKQLVTAQSLAKIEDAYAIVIRTSEYDLPPEMLDDIVAQSVSNLGSGGKARGAWGEEDGSVGED